MIHYPISAIIGDLGSGKTLYLTYLATLYQKEGINIYANYHLKGIDYTYLEFKDLAQFPEHVKDGVLLMDEGHVDGDAYNFLRKGVRDMGKFITQMRKRRLMLFYSTQDFASIFIRLRELTNYIMLIQPVNTKGLTKVTTYDKRGGLIMLTSRIYNLSSIFGKYDTEEIIGLPENDDSDIDTIMEEDFINE